MSAKPVLELDPSTGTPVAVLEPPVPGDDPELAPIEPVEDGDVAKGGLKKVLRVLRLDGEPDTPSGMPIQDTTALVYRGSTEALVERRAPRAHATPVTGRERRDANRNSKKKRESSEAYMTMVHLRQKYDHDAIGGSNNVRTTPAGQKILDKSRLKYHEDAHEHAELQHELKESAALKDKRGIELRDKFFSLKDVEPRYHKLLDKPRLYGFVARTEWDTIELISEIKADYGLLPGQSIKDLLPRLRKGERQAILDEINDLHKAARLEYAQESGIEDGHIPDVISNLFEQRVKLLGLKNITEGEFTPYQAFWTDGSKRKYVTIVGYGKKTNAGQYVKVEGSDKELLLNQTKPTNIDQIYDDEERTAPERKIEYINNRVAQLTSDFGQRSKGDNKIIEEARAKEAKAQEKAQHKESLANAKLATKEHNKAERERRKAEGSIKIDHESPEEREARNGFSSARVAMRGLKANIAQRRAKLAAMNATRIELGNTEGDADVASKVEAKRQKQARLMADAKKLRDEQQSLRDAKTARKEAKGSRPKRKKAGAESDADLDASIDPKYRNVLDKDALEHLADEVTASVAKKVKRYETKHRGTVPRAIGEQFVQQGIDKSLKEFFELVFGDDEPMSDDVKAFMERKLREHEESRNASDEDDS